MRKLLWALSVATAMVLSGCGYNDFQTRDEQVKSAWAEVLNQYQRRADLIPNLVQTVQGYAAQERDVLIGVTNARAKATSIQATPEMVNDPAAMARFAQAQGELSGALSRLLVTVENYPQLKSDALFRDLQAQLEGTENRITVERMRFNEVAQAYNTARLRFPTNLMAGMFGFKEKPYFRSAPGSERAPEVQFDFRNPTPPAAAAPAPATTP